MGCSLRRNARRVQCERGLITGEQRRPLPGSRGPLGASRGLVIAARVQHENSIQHC